MNYKAALIGDPRPISDEDLETFRQMGGGRTAADRAGGTGDFGVAWETYRRMVDD